MSFMGHWCYLIFSREVSLTAKLLLVSSEMHSKYPFVVSISLVTFFFAFTARMSSGYHLKHFKIKCAMCCKLSGTKEDHTV